MRDPELDPETLHVSDLLGRSPWFLVAHIMRDLDDESGSRSEIRAGTHAPFAHRHRDGHLPATWARESAARHGENDAHSGVRRADQSSLPCPHPIACFFLEG